MAPRVYACLYIRKSNETEDGKSLKDQIAEGREYCKRMGWILRDEHIFVDEESAYLKPAEKRQAFIEMVNLAVAKKPPFTKVVVWKVDRFARRTQDGFKYWQMLADNDVEVCSMTQTFGEGAGGRFNLGIHLMMAQFYSDNLSEDVKRGLRRAALKGYWSSNLVPLGYERYKVDSGYKLRIVEKDAEIVRQIFDFAIKGWGLKQIAAQIGLSKHRIANILHNEHYTGDRIIRNKAKNKILLRVADAHPRIIDKTTYEKANRSLKNRFKAKHSVGVGDALYGKILKCHCGRLMHRQTKKSRHRKNSTRYTYYVCNGKKDGTGCIAGNVREETITALVLDLIKDNLFSVDSIEKMFKLAETKRRNGELEKATRHLNRQLAENKSKQRNLIEMVRDGMIEMDEIKDDMHQLKADADALEAKLDFAPEQPIKPAAMKKLVAQLERDLYKDGPARRDAMRELVKEIVVDLPILRITTSLMAVEDTYEIFYYPPPTVPDNYRNLTVQQKRLIVAQIRRFIGDTRKRDIISYHDNRTPAVDLREWNAAKLTEFLDDYVVSQNDVRTLEKTTKTEKAA